MDKRVERFLRLAVATADKVPPGTRPELVNWVVIAVLLDEATKPVKRKKKEENRPALPFSPQELYEAVKATGVVACDPYNPRWFSMLGKKLHSMMPALQASDLQALVGWLESGGLKWMKERPSFGTLVKHIEDWIPRARAADDGQLELDLRGRV